MRKDTFVLEGEQRTKPVYHKVRLDRSLSGAVRLLIGPHVALEARSDEPGIIVFHRDYLRANGFNCLVD